MAAPLEALKIRISGKLRNTCETILLLIFRTIFSQEGFDAIRHLLSAFQSGLLRTKEKMGGFIYE